MRLRSSLACAVLLFAATAPAESPLAPIKKKLDKRTPAKDMLPVAPKELPIYIGESLGGAPELLLEAPPEKKLDTKGWIAHLADLMA